MSITVVNIYLIKIKLGKKKITDKPGKNAAKGKATKIKIVSAGTAQLKRSVPLTLHPMPAEPTARWACAPISPHQRISPRASASAFRFPGRYSSNQRPRPFSRARS